MAVSVCVAVYLSLQPQRLSDLQRLSAFCGQWLHGAHVYVAAPIVYPPWALVSLSWLALLPDGWLGPVWVAVNLLMLAGAAALIARRFGASATPTAVLTCLLIAAGAGRSLNQFSLVSFTFGALGYFGAGRWRGVCLGLACMKPQIGGVFLLATMLERRWRDLAVAACVPVALTLIYALVAHVGIGQALTDYLGSATAERNGMTPGRTELTPLILARWRWIGPVAAAALVAAIAATPLMRAARRDPSRGAFWLGAALVSLLSVRHLSYDFILFLPWLATLEGAPLWIVACLIVGNPSGVIGMVAPMSFAAMYADRLLIVALWLGTLRAAIEPRRETFR